MAPVGLPWGHHRPFQAQCPTACGLEPQRLEVDATFMQACLDDFGAGLEAHGALDHVSCDMPAALCLMNK